MIRRGAVKMCGQMTNKCSTKGCAQVVKAKGFCSKHHQQWLRAKKRIKPPLRRKPCTIPLCENLAATKVLYCRNHQRKFELYGDPHGGRIVHVLCTVKGCNLKHSAKGLCKKHYSQLYTRKSEIKKTNIRLTAAMFTVLALGTREFAQFHEAHHELIHAFLDAIDVWY